MELPPKFLCTQVKPSLEFVKMLGHTEFVTVKRHLYITNEGEFFLCEKCHNATTFEKHQNTIWDMVCDNPLCQYFVPFQGKDVPRNEFYLEKANIKVHLCSSCTNAVHMIEGDNKCLQKKVRNMPPTTR